MTNSPDDRDEGIPDEIVLPLEDFLDLHPFRPADVRSVTESYLEQAIEAGFREVRLIHGRGIGVQREIVRSLLSSHPGVLAFGDAGAERGGWGATLVRLAPADSREGRGGGTESD